MNYKKIYDNLILKTQSENRIKIKGGSYYERHHITPKCLGGNNLKENLVLLTAKEHFVAHKLLVEIYPTNKKLIKSLYMMSMMSKGINRFYIVSSREYDAIRTKFSKLMSGRVVPSITKEKQSLAKIGKVSKLKGRKRSEETRDKISTSKRGGKLSDLHKNKISVSNLGKHSKSKSTETKNRMSQSKIGKPSHRRGCRLSEETKLKISEYNKNLPKVVCPHCGKEGKTSGMKVWHFDNCKLKQ